VKEQIMTELFTVREVAKILKCNPQTVRRYIREGLLKAVTLKGEYRIKEEHLNAFLEDGSKKK